MNDNKTPQTIEEENEALLEEIHQKSDSSSPAASRTLGATLSSVCARTSLPLSR